MSYKFIPAKNDVMFKALFVRNEDILKQFLSDMLDISLDSFVELKIKNSEIIPEHIDGKLSRLDINLQTKDRNINIEMQSGTDRDYRDRILFYWAKMYSDSIESGETYGTLNESISLSVLDFNMFDCKEYQSVFRVYEKNRHELLSDKLMICFFELPKIEGALNISDSKQVWLKLIDADSEEELNMLENANNPMVNKSITKIRELNADEKLREYIRQRDKANMEYNAAMYHAEQRGIEKGRAEIISKMRAAGLDDDKIKLILDK